MKTGCFCEYTCEGAKPQIACDCRWHALLKAFLWAQISRFCRPRTLALPLSTLPFQGTSLVFKIAASGVGSAGQRWGQRFV